MNILRCPNCNQEFEVDETHYESLLKQIRDKEFNKELEAREKSLESQKEIAIKLARSESEMTHKDEINKKDSEIAELKAKLENAECDKKLAITEALQEKDKEIADRNDTIFALKNKLDLNQTKYELEQKNLKESYETKLKDKETQIDYYKDLKAKLSTKMVGETLEQHCEIEFNKIRPTAFPNAYFEKDNDSSSGSKGDYIFRDYAPDGTEIISIMFDMKNEMDATDKKHKNEDFFKKLDKDRNEKKCEYAILVSLLEADNELYNGGITDVSYRYPKMYVVRPQCFISIITLLRNAALSSLEYKQELAIARNQDIDLIHFEENMNDFKEKFSKNYNLASERFGKAIDEIDKSIDHLQKIKDNLLSSINNLRLANNKLEDVTIKKLTKNCPTIAEKFVDLKNNGNKDDNR